LVAALSRIEDGVLILDAHNVVEMTNVAAERIFDMKAGVRRGRTFIEVVRDYEFDLLLRRSLETRCPQDTVIKTRRGKILNVAIMPLDDIPGHIVIVRDLTERNRLEEIHHDLISNISHEFKTPISSIKLLAETLLQGAIKDERVANEFLEKIGIEADKLAQMTEELSLLAKLESGEADAGRGETDIGGLIRQAVARLSTQAQKAGLKMEVDLAANLPRPVIDGDRIESVLLNLIGNAIKFTGRGGTITLAAGVDEDNILVSVADTGIGIQAGELSRIFERFYKVDKSRAGEGSGLGLAISRNIIKAHGGRIWAESQEDKGSTFYFTLPLI